MKTPKAWNETGIWFFLQEFIFRFSGLDLNVQNVFNSENLRSFEDFHAGKAGVG